MWAQGKRISASVLRCGEYCSMRHPLKSAIQRFPVIDSHTIGIGALGKSRERSSVRQVSAGREVIGVYDAPDGIGVIEDSAIWAKHRSVGHNVAAIVQ